LKLTFQADSELAWVLELLEWGRIPHSALDVTVTFQISAHTPVDHDHPEVIEDLK
jgi:hypothetical protein